MILYVSRRRSFAEYWKHFVARFNDVHASGYNSAGSERIWMKFGELRVYFWSWCWQILGEIRAEARAGDRTEILFFLWGKQRTTLPISGQPYFTKFAHKTWICVAILSENIFENLPVRGLFLPKRSTFAWTSSRLPTRPRYLRNEHKSGKVMTGYHAYRMLAFLLYHWNQLKVIPLACRLHTLRM